MIKSTKVKSSKSPDASERLPELNDVKGTEEVKSTEDNEEGEGIVKPAVSSDEESSGDALSEEDEDFDD